MVTTVPVVVGAGTSIESAAVALPHVGWDTYERLLADDEERQVPRLTYDRGGIGTGEPVFAGREVRSDAHPPD